jgi:hemolysin III
MARAGRVYSRGELRADAAIHAAGLIFAALGGPVLIVAAAARGEAAAVAATSVYVATMLAMFAASALYNHAPAPRWRETFRRLDHGAIYLKIAGAYTPFAAVPLAAGPGKGLLLAVWAVAGAGCAAKLMGLRRLEALSIPLYLGLGWALVWVWDDATRLISAPALQLLAVGGGLYTAGVAFHLWERLPFQNAIWHLHVLLATVCMYAAVAVEIA